eukprot:6212453-Pleurochrysis_carterae.AAC.2
MSCTARALPCAPFAQSFVQTFSALLTPASAHHTRLGILLKPLASFVVLPLAHAFLRRTRNPHFRSTRTSLCAEPFTTVSNTQAPQTSSAHARRWAHRSPLRRVLATRNPINGTRVLFEAAPACFAKMRCTHRLSRGMHAGLCAGRLRFDSLFLARTLSDHVYDGPFLHARLPKVAALTSFVKRVLPLISHAYIGEKQSHASVHQHQHKRAHVQTRPKHAHVHTRAYYWPWSGVQHKSSRRSHPCPW